MSQITNNTEVVTKADLAEFYQRILPYLNGSPIDYSNTEKVVGTWIDGKPLYQKVLTGTTPSTAQDQDIGAISTLLAPNADIKEISGLIAWASGNLSGVKCFSWFDNSDKTAIYTNNGHMYISITGASNLSQPYHIIVRYTKTTD